MRKQFLLLATVVAVVGVINGSITDYFALQVVTLTLIWAAAGVAWNMPASAGQISLGHSAFTGIGAFGFVYLSTEYGTSPWLGMAISMVAAALMALVIGLPTFRLQGFYFTLATMAFPLILMILVVSNGHPEMTVPYDPTGGFGSMQFSDPRSFGWLALACFAIVAALGLWIAGSRAGRILTAIKDNEVLARSLGIRTLPWKLAPLCLSAAICAAIGVIWVNAILLVVTADEVFGLTVSILLISVTFVGGIGTPWGPIVGAAVLIPLTQILTVQIGDRVPGAESIVYGVALVLSALLMPRGIVPTLVTRFKKGRRSDAPAESEISAEASRQPAAPAAPAPERRPTSATAVGAEPILEVFGLGKSYGAVNVLQDTAFTVVPGARLGLIGPNGAGKTTLFNLLTGHGRADAGEITYRGESITKLHAPARCKLGIARTFQVPQGFPSMTAAENVEVAGIGVGMSMTDARSAAARVLARVGLEHRADSPLSSLTAFELKLLELARACASEPQLLLLDEPLAGLTESERQAFFEVLDRVADPSTAVVVIEHSVKALLKFASELLALDGGRIIAAGEPSAVVNHPQVIEAYLGRKFAAKHLGLATVKESS